jgi:hypothetical protein
MTKECQNPKAVFRRSEKVRANSSTKLRIRFAIRHSFVIRHL